MRAQGVVGIAGGGFSNFEFYRRGGQVKERERESTKRLKEKEREREVYWQSNEREKFIDNQMRERESTKRLKPQSPILI
jgi:hypothetical protein